MKDTKLSHFEIDIPDSLIAKKPATFRDEARMLVLHRSTGEVEHRQVKDILDYFQKDDVFVFNDTKVFPARMYGNKEKTGAQIEVFLLRELNPALKLWDVVVDPARKIRIGNKLYFGKNDELVAEVIEVAPYASSTTVSRKTSARCSIRWERRPYPSISHVPQPMKTPIATSHSLLRTKEPSSVLQRISTLAVSCSYVWRSVTYAKPSSRYTMD
mgnify:CR=1 FL=1